MKEGKNTRTLCRLIFAIRREEEGTYWAPYRDAMDWYLAAYATNTLCEVQAKFHIDAIVSRWQREGCELPISL